MKLHNISGLAVTVFFTIFVAVSILAAGTYSWISIAQKMTNKFTYQPYDLRLVKLDADTAEPLAGAIFDLYDEDDNHIGRYTTDMDGVIEICWEDGESQLDTSKQYYFKEYEAPYGYIIIGDGETELYPPDGSEITMTNKAVDTVLSIHKAIGSKMLDGSDYDAASDNEFPPDYPYEFTVEIGDDPDALYRFQIINSNGDAVTDYTYAAEGISVQGSGEIKSGERIWLRRGDTAYFDGITPLTYYNVTEKNYFEIILDPTVTEYGCENAAEHEHAEHNIVMGVGSGWASYGNNTVGNLREEGSVVSFENIRVPENYEITMSSLVVVDRILAHPDDIDPQKGFRVTITIGDDVDQSYYYEVVHIEDTMRVLNDYDHEYEYYRRNDPGVPQPLQPQSVGMPSNLQPFTVGIIDIIRQATEYFPTVRTRRGLPSSYAATPPYHNPSLAERWPRVDGQYQPLSVSDGNTIEVDLHHASAIIVYSIPVGTSYNVWQVDYTNIDGYMIDSTIKTVGTILPDLDFLEDNETDDIRIMRARADIYNYFVLPIMRTIEINKNWEHGENPAQDRPTSTKVHVVDKDANIKYDSRTLVAISNWSDSVTVPKYNPDTGALIDYGIEEEMPPGYEMSKVEETATGFDITNTFIDAVQPQELAELSVEKHVDGKDADKDKGFTFTATIGNMTYTFTLKDGEKRVFSDIPVGTQYSIVEKDYVDEGYLASASGSTGTVPKGGAVASFVNTYSKDRDKTIADLTVTKTVSGISAETKKDFRFTVAIGSDKQVIWLRDGESHTFTDIPVGTWYSITEDSYEGYVTRSRGATGNIKNGANLAEFENRNDNAPKTSKLTVYKKVEGGKTGERFEFLADIGELGYRITLSDGERYVFEDIPVGTPYSVRELDSKGYAVSAEGTDGTITEDDNTAEFVNTAKTVSGEDGSAVLTVTKTVTGSFIDTTKSFRFVVTIGGIAYEIYLKDGESYSFADIPLGTAYSVIEDDYAPQDYVTFSKNATGTIDKDGVSVSFVNRYIGEAWPKPDDDAVQISGKKTWIHASNKDYPASITVLVMSGDVVVTKKEVTAEDNWQYAFNLPKYAGDGSTIEYTINEEPVENYTKLVKGYDLENTFRTAAAPQTGDSYVMWIWFAVLLAGIVGLRIVVFYRGRKK